MILDTCLKVTHDCDNDLICTLMQYSVESKSACLILELHFYPPLCRELDSAMERRLEEMERRLKEHVDRRLDALEQKLEKALLSALPQFALGQRATSGSVGEAASSGPSEQTILTPAMH